MRQLLILILWLPVVVLAEPYQLLRSAPDGFAPVTPGRVFDFPADHLPHPAFRIEWWYLTANLRDEEGRPVSVQWTLFRQSMDPGPDTSGWSSNQVWMAHAAVSMDGQHEHEERFARGGIGQAGVAFDDQRRFSAWLDDWHWQATGAENRR